MEQDRKADRVGMADWPLPAILGYLYARKLTGTLQAADSTGTLVPFVFWFKRGLPCFSHSQDRIARLGEQLPAARRPAGEGFLAAQPAMSAEARPLAGQLLVGRGLITMDELQAALLGQLLARLQCCAAGDYLFRFEEGTEQLGPVPLSSPLLNPVEAAARISTATPYERVRTYLLGQLDRPEVRLAKDRRIPPVIRPHLSQALLDSFTGKLEVSRVLDIPSQVRTLAFLHAFGFVEQLEAPRTPAVTMSEETESAAPAKARDENRLLSRLLLLARSGATWYELLGVAPTASREEVKAAYRNVAFEIHPDRVPPAQAGASQEVFGQLVEAYHNLSKERLRVAYDALLIRSGGWRNLGPPETIDGWLQGRRSYLDRIGLTTLACEYDRMLAAR
jgi:DnaJ-domain-containing protein 1